MAGTSMRAGAGRLAMAVRWILAAVLIVFAALQYNDPDALLWIAIYGLAAMWCILGAQRPGLLRRSPLLRSAAIASLVVYLLGFLWEIRDFNADFLGRTMMEPGVETTREAFGLLICALVTAYLLWADRRPGGTAAASP
jgi:hypothetical protein